MGSTLQIAAAVAGLLLFAGLLMLAGLVLFAILRRRSPATVVSDLASVVSPIEPAKTAEEQELELVAELYKRHRHEKQLEAVRATMVEAAGFQAAD